MPPAAVKRHLKIGIAAPRDGDDPRNRVVETIRIEGEMPGVAAFGGGENETAALAYRGGGQQEIGIVGRAGCHSLPPALRPPDLRIQAAASGVAQFVPARLSVRGKIPRGLFRRDL